MLAMINVAALGGVRNWPTIAELGLSSVFYILLGAICFFVPIGLIAAELATAWPKNGGVLAWVEEAFGHRWGFLAAWLLWSQSIVWYPTVLSFIAGTFAYVINPELASDRWYTLSVILLCLWGATLLNFLGMKVSGWFSSIGTVLGIFVPAFTIIFLGGLWFFSKNPLQVTLSWGHFIPSFQNINHLVFFAGVILSYTGIEMSAVHIKEMQNPQKDYPKAIFFSLLIFVAMTTFGVLAIVFVIDQHQISLTSGLMQTFTVFLNTFHFPKLIPLFASLVAFGALGSVATWLVGPTKAILASAEKGDLPPFFRQVNSHGMPKNLLLIQALAITFLCFIFLFMPTINSAYWMLSAFVVELYLLMYFLLCAAAIKLRYKYPSQIRPYKIPGGNLGIWIVAGLAFSSSLFAAIIGFFPPSDLSVGNHLFYICFLLFGVIFFCLCPSFILFFKKPSWNEKLKHEE